MLKLRCTLLRDTFEGGRHDDPSTAEWPPSWMRVFSALVSVAGTSRAFDSVLQRLEAAGPPDILAANAVPSTRREAYVPTNAVQEVTAHGTLVGRTASVRAWARTAPAIAKIYYEWLELVLSEPDQLALTTLCRAVPYLGRSTSPAILDVVTASTNDADLRRLVPRTRTTGAFIPMERIRCPYPGALEELRRAHAEKFLGGGVGDPWAVGVTTDYGEQQRPPAIDDAVAGRYPVLVIFALRGLRLDGRHTARVTSAFRRAILGRATRHLPTLHGHHDGEVVQCAFLALPFVGGPRADGRLLGVAIAVPELPDQELGVVVDALGAADQVLEVTAGPLGVLRLERISPLESTAQSLTLQPRRWQQPSRTWVTALPLVFDRHVRRGDDEEEHVRRAVVHAGLPDPASVRVSRRPLVTGALDLRPTDTLRRRGDKSVRPYRHALLHFPMKVRGPVLLGSMRHYGLGLCLPLPEPRGGVDD